MALFNLRKKKMETKVLFNCDAKVWKGQNVKLKVHP